MNERAEISAAAPTYNKTSCHLSLHMGMNKSVLRCECTFTPHERGSTAFARGRPDAPPPPTSYATRSVQLPTCSEPVLSPGPAFQMLRRDLPEEAIGLFKSPGGAGELLPAFATVTPFACAAPPAPLAVCPVFDISLGSSVGAVRGLAGLDPR